MPVRLARGVITPKSRYVCPFCHSYGFSRVGEQTRYQHSSTGPPANVNGDPNQKAGPKHLGDNNDSTSLSSIGDLIRDFMSKAKEKDTKSKKSKGDSGYDSHEPSSLVSRDIHSVAPPPEDNTDVGQRKLQHTFTAQRRKDMLAMQTSQVSKKKEEIKDVSKARPIPVSIKQSPKMRSSRAVKRERKLEEALAKKTIAKQKQAKPIDSAQKEVRKTAKPKEFQATAESPTKIQAAGDQGANNEDTARNTLGTQFAIARKLDDIMDVLETSKDLKRSKKPVKAVQRAGGVETKSTDTELSVVVNAILDELQDRGELGDENPQNAAAAISHSKRERLELLKPTSEELSQSSKLQILTKQALGDGVSLVRKFPSPFTTDSPPSMKGQSNKTRSRARHGKIKVKESKQDPVGLSLRAALKNKRLVRKLVTNKSKQYPDGTRSRRVALKNKRLVRSVVDKKSDDMTPRRIKEEPVDRARACTKLSSEKANKISPLKSPIKMITASDLELMPVAVDQPPVPSLAYGLERVLFNPGVYQLQDPRSRVYNFDPYLQKIMPIAEFDFNALKEYITSSRDESLNKIAKEQGKRYMGSTSSMTDVLRHFHYLLSQWRPINPSMLSKAFPARLYTFSEFQRSPSAIILNWKNGSYAIDADKQYATANILSMLGKSMEKLLTLNTNDFERYRKSNPGQVTEDEQFAPESYHYSTLGDFLMRSQLDAHDPRLPGTGMFDLKTRSVVSIRMDLAHYEHGIGYEIKNREGEWESYEREYYDMIRSAFLKYSLQVRMGRMDGIFVAFHNIERIFGFQYISLPEMDSTIHGQWDTSIGDQEFRLSLDLMNKVLDRATKKYPETSLRLFFEARPESTPFMYAFAEPVTERQVAQIQSGNDARIKEIERNIMGLIHGSDSDTNDAPEVDSKWEKIQADVQKAIGEGAEGTQSNPNRPEVFEQGPLYARKSASGADDGSFAVSAGHEEDEGEDDDDDDGEDESENEEEEEDEEESKEDGDGNGIGEVEESRWQERPEEFLEEEAKIKAIDIFEAERNVDIDGDGTDENNVALSEDDSVKDQSTINIIGGEPNEDVTPDARSRQQTTKDTREPTDDEQSIRIPLDAEPNAVAEGESLQVHQTHANQTLLDSINEEFGQADATAKSSGSKDILAMKISLRNKVNGEYVPRPVEMTATDDWSIEYSLTELSKTRAELCYNACRLRRKKMAMKGLVPDDDEAISDYIRKLRSLSEEGRKWRKKQDNIDGEQPVQVL